MRTTRILCSTALWFALLATVAAQDRPYIGFVYPAGGQRGTTFEIRLGGQGLDDVNGVLVSGSGVTAKVADYYRRLNMEELQLLSEQLYALRQDTLSDAARAELMRARTPGTMSDVSPAPAPKTDETPSARPENTAAQKLISRIEHRTMEFNSNPASEAIASLVIVEVTIAPDAEPGEREIRLVTLRGASTPLPFHVGQLPEVSKHPIVTASQQVLGKEADSLRHQPGSEDEDHLALPCTVNGQISSGEVNRYRFSATQGQRLVITTLGRQLVPFIADAVPGWFQPVLALYDANGKEVAYNDDYRFKPDPTLFYEVPKDGEYTFAIHDALYRGREDFVYRITVGELPFITSMFPLGDRVGAPAQPEIKGWNLQGATLSLPPADAGPGIYSVSVQAKGTTASTGSASPTAANARGLVSNPIPFARGTLPEIVEQEPNNTPATAQKVSLPVIINGRIGRPDDWDVFQFTGKAGDTVVAEVMARRLDSPLDSVLKLTDAAGNLLAYNDDHEDLGAGLNTHHADSYLMARLPADGPYFIHLGDIARQGGEEYGYRLRLSAPQPDFELRVVPSSLSLQSKSTNALTVYALRKDGFAGPITLDLKDPPAGFSATSVTLSGTQNVARVIVKNELIATREPVTLTVMGTSKLGEQQVAREAIPAEDRMQAFLWRHLVPAKELKAVVFNPSYLPPPKRTPHPRPRPAPVVAAVVSTNSVGGTNAPPVPKFTKEQVAGRLRALRQLFEEGMINDDFFNDEVAELDAAK